MSVSLSHRRYGGDGEPLLILHGLFGSARNWHSQATALARSFTVITVDLRNHGSSPHTPDIGYPQMAADVLALMDRLGLDTGHLLGHSMGGKVAMQIALNDPQRIAKLVVVDIAPRRYPPHHDEILQAMDEVDLAAVPDRAGVDAALSAAIPDKGVRQFILTNLTRRDGRFAWQLNLAAIARHYAQLSEAPRGPQPFAGPTLFIKGANSAYIGAGDRESIGALFPGARAQVIANTGHWPHAEKPQTFNRIVHEFLLARS